MGQSLTALYYHLVFSTKHRNPDISDELAARLYPYIGGIIANNGGHLIRGGGMPDHVHLLVRFAKLPPIPQMVRFIKGNSSLWVHRSFPRQQSFRWQNGCGMFTVDPTTLEQKRRYIDNQKEHHRNVTFKQEYIALLQEHEIEYDERYIWD